MLPQLPASGDDPRLTKQTRVSFTTDSPLAVVALLQQHGYQPLAPRQYEVARLVQRTAIAVVYQTGTVLCQGSNPRALIGLLDRAAQECTQTAPEPLGIQQPLF